MKRSGLQAVKTNKLKSNTAHVPVSCLISGFEPFNKSYKNPSADLVALLSGCLHLGQQQIEIKSLVLPSVANKAWVLLKKEIDALPKRKKSIVIMLGQAANRKLISIERFALNFRDYRIKDNAGKVYTAQVLDNKAPDAIRNKASIEEALAYLLKKGAPVEASNYAGTFVCNEVYFRMLNYLEQAKLKHLVYFVHVPLPKVYGKTLAMTKQSKWSKLAKGEKNQLNAMKIVIELLVEFNAGLVGKK